MKKCKEVNELMSLYIDGLLDDEKTREFEEHINNCRACRSELDEMLAVVRMCNDVEEVKVPDDFKSKLHSKLTAVKEEESNKKKSFYVKYRKLIKVCTSAAVLLIVAFAARGLFNEIIVTDKVAREDSAMEKSSVERSGEEASDQADDFSVSGGNTDEVKNLNSDTSDTYKEEDNDTKSTRPEDQVSMMQAIEIEENNEEKADENSDTAQTARFDKDISDKPEYLNSVHIRIHTSEPASVMEKFTECAKNSDIRIFPVIFFTEDNDSNESYIRVLNSDYKNFLDSLKNRFFSTLTVVEDVDINYVKNELNKTEDNIELINRKINETSNPDVLKELKNSMVIKEKRKESLKEEIKYKTIYVEIIESNNE